MKKLRYKIILFTTIVFLGFFIVEKVTNLPIALLSPSDLKSYIKVYSNKYKSLLTLVPPDYKDKIIFFTPNYYIEGIISLTHGAAVKLSASDKEIIKITVTKEKIEKIISPNARYPGRMIVDKIRFRLINNPLPTFKNLSVDNNAELTILNDSGRDIISNRQLDLKNESEVYIYDGDSQTIVKESNYKETWTKQIAIRDATSEFLYQIRNSILEKSRMNDIVSSVKLATLAREIAEKETRKEYVGNEELYINDHREFFKLAGGYNISNTVAEKILQEVKNSYFYSSFINKWIKPNLDKLIVGILVGVIVYLITNKGKKKSNKKKGKK